jgi:hypothetical protein
MQSDWRDGTLADSHWRRWRPLPGQKGLDTLAAAQLVGVPPPQSVEVDYAVIRPLRPAARCRDVSVEALIRELLDVITAACRARNRGAVRWRCWPSPDKNAPAAS